MGGRDEYGRFTTGNPGGPGRPPRGGDVDYLETMLDEVSLDDWHRIALRAVADAKGDDPRERATRARAREWLARYLCPSVKALGSREPDPPSTFCREMRQLLGLN